MSPKYYQIRQDAVIHGIAETLSRSSCDFGHTALLSPRTNWGIQVESEKRVKAYYDVIICIESRFHDRNVCALL